VLRKSFCGWNHTSTKMITPTPASAAALMTGCLRASGPSDQNLAGLPCAAFPVFIAIASLQAGT
jgi:hypothetical protein